MSKYILKFVKSDASVKQAYTACNLWPNVLVTALNFKISTTGYIQAFSQFMACFDIFSCSVCLKLFVSHKNLPNLHLSYKNYLVKNNTENTIR